MFEYRGLLVIFIAGYLLVAFGGCAQGEDSGSGSTSSGYKKTYVTGIERVLKGLSKALPSKSSSSSSEGIGGFLTSHLPQPIDNIISEAANATKEGFGDILNLFEENFHAIFPGTLWCGAGNIASDEQDVGVFNRTDACCRDHDNCPSNIAAGKTKGDLINNGIFTRSACDCDHKFYRCLKNASSIIADNIGTTYFNLLRPQCFELNYPIESCAKYEKGRLLAKKCAKYNFDTSQAKELDWIDNPDY